MSAPTFAVTVGQGKKGAQGRLHALPESTSSVRSLVAFLEALPADGIETWWAGTEWRDHYRSKETFTRTFLVPCDVDHHDANGKHSLAVPADLGVRLADLARLGAFGAQLYHETPGGGRLLYVLSDWTNDPARYATAFQGMEALATEVLGTHGLAAQKRGKDRVSGFVVDTTIKDLGRMLWAPRMKRDDKGRHRDADVILLSEEPTAIESLEARAPSRRRAQTRAERELVQWIAKVRQAPNGQRNDTLNKASFALGQLVGYGALDRATVERDLEAADLRVGEPEVEATKRTIQSGIDAGIEKPRAPGRRDAGDDGRPSYLVDHEQAEAVDFAEQALAQRPALEIYKRGSRVVTITREAVPLTGIEERSDAPVITALEVETVRERLGRAVDWRAFDKRGNESSIMTPWFIAPTLMKRREWPALRFLAGIVTGPTLRADWTVLQEPGYDERSGLYYAPRTEYPPVPESPTRDNAGAAAALIYEYFHEFPYTQPSGAAVAIAGVVTLTIRDAIPGPTPIFAADAPEGGTGKTLLCQGMAAAALGHTAELMRADKDDAELDKTFVSVGYAGIPALLLDNATRPFGCSSVEAASTAWPTYFSRRLGGNEVLRVPWRTVLMVTGCNLQFSGMTGRRVVSVRLDAEREDPEARQFKRPGLIPYLLEEHPRLRVAALTIARAAAIAGWPDHGYAPMGSFESWDATVRRAVVWAMGKDPCEDREARRRHADPEREQLRELIGRIRDRFGTEGWTSDDLLSAAKESDAWRNMLLGFVPRRRDGGKELDRASIGYRLRGRLSNRVVALRNGNDERIGEFRIVPTGAEIDHLVQWKVEEVRHA